MPALVVLGAATAVPQEPRQSPAETLRSDELDRPAETSRRDAEKAAALAQEMAGHAMHHATSYRHDDAGRGAAPSPSPTPKPSPHHHHEGQR